MVLVEADGADALDEDDEDEDDEDDDEDDDADDVDDADDADDVDDVDDVDGPALGLAFTASRRASASASRLALLCFLTSNFWTLLLFF